MSVSNNKTSYLISDQLPQFVKDDHTGFVTFLEEYYNFMAEEGNTEYVSKNFTNYMDIDIIKGHIDEEHLYDYKDYHAFLQAMYNNFTKVIPNKILTDQSLILKHIKEFYTARGSEKSVKFLLRILLNKETDRDIGFYYPKRDVLRASDGKWYVEKVLRIGDIRVDNLSNTIAYTNFVNRTIRGASSNATATVESVDSYFKDGASVIEIKLSSAVKEFENGETVFSYYTEEGSDHRLSANIFSGIITSFILEEGGTGYVTGSSVPIEGGGGSGAHMIVKTVSQGGLENIVLSQNEGGAGFRSSDEILITGGGGSGATAVVSGVDLTEKYHPNSYNVISSVISLEANTPIGNAVYSNLSASLSDPANAWMSNSFSAWSYSNTGPAITMLVTFEGTNYLSVPTLSIKGNNTIRSLGILGRMSIDEGGLNYNVGDILEFSNPIGSFGSEANATVTAIDANGSITEVKFQPKPGHFTGGQGYNQELLPTINVASTTGNGANITVITTLGYGEQLTASTGVLGRILELQLLDGGANYTTAPTINLANMAAGSGARANCFITTGAYNYPGRYLNDDGQLSSYNFLEDRDYYQNYSYVVRINASLKDYRNYLLNLTHPSGTKLFGQYLLESNTKEELVSIHPEVSNTRSYIGTYQVQTNDVLLNGVYNVNSIGSTYAPVVYNATYSLRQNVSASYSSTGKNIVINSPGHWLNQSDNVHLQFSNATANIINGYYTVSSANANYFSVAIKNGNTSFVVLPTVTSNLTANTGTGSSNNYVKFDKWVANSNVTINIGDSLNVSGNIVSVVYKFSNDTLLVTPALPGNVVSNTVFVSIEPYRAYGNVKFFDTAVTIVVNTNLSAGSNTYFKFNTSDTSLSNDIYDIRYANGVQLKIRHDDIVNAASFSGNVTVHTRKVEISSGFFGLEDGNTVYLLFNDGDTGNAFNNIYTVTEATSNSFNINTSNPVVSGGNVSVITANVIANITNHGFQTEDSVYMWFTSGDTANLSNDYHTVTKIDNNRFIYRPTKVPAANGNLSVYRNYMNVTINRTNHGLFVNDNVSVWFETGNIEDISNGVFRINNVANTDTLNVKHEFITISSNISNLLVNGNGQCYISSHDYVGIL